MSIQMGFVDVYTVYHSCVCVCVYVCRYLKTPDIYAPLMRIFTESCRLTLGDCD